MIKYILIFLFLAGSLKAQTIVGMVTDADSNPLPSATVQIQGTSSYELTDAFGKFTIDLQGRSEFLVINFVGFDTDTVKATAGKFLQVELSSDNRLDEVIVKSQKSFVDADVVQVNEVLLETELLKSACCNLSESFATNASVDVSYADAVTGTRQIKMLGLDGKYVYMLREDIPMIRGLITTNGLSMVPGTWLQTIDVGKGAGSVANGYESMTGQINLDFKNPESKEKLYLNAYVNAMSRAEINGNYTADLSDKVSTAILTHANMTPLAIDNNGDGIMDVPKGRQFNILNRYKITEDRVVTQLGFQIMHDERVGGQNDFKFGEDPQTSTVYGINLKSRRYEVYGKTGVLFPKKPYLGLGILYSGAYNERKEGFGTNRYEGVEKSFYGNAIFQGILGSSFHKYRVGASILLDNYDETLNDSTFLRNEVVPGGFFEYSFSGPHAWSFVAGMRTDYHNLYGWLVTPRFHTQYGFSDDSSIRFSIGKGVRVPNVIAENTSMLASSRSFIVQEEIRPEESWNIGGSISHVINIGSKPMNLVMDYFHTNFENQLIVDRDLNVNQVNFYNLNGKSFANSFQFEAKYELISHLTAKAAYKFYQVKTSYQNFGLRDAPFIPKDRFFVNLEYSTHYDKWVFDWTGQWYGNQRIPNTDQNQEVFQVADVSQSYFIMNAQVKRAFRWGSVYVGGENLLNYKQNDPIIDPQNPFGNNFDATLVWGPVAGRAIYAGVRYKLNKRN